MKITFWWRQTSGYFNACTEALVDAGHDVSVVYGSTSSFAPFHSLTQSGYTHLKNVSTFSGKPSGEILKASLNDHPDVLVVSSWGIRPYVQHAQIAPRNTVRLVGVDSPWRSSPKQVAGQFAYRNFLRRAFDGAWVTGTPQRHLVRRLGFQTPQIMEHLYCCDSRLFSPELLPKHRILSPFLFVGRLVKQKGVAQLLDAFRSFRQLTGSPRNLRIVGSGPMRIQGDGIELYPFAEPGVIRKYMDESFALVHPALLEHWGVVVHEAASMGLPLILSPSVHAGTRYLSPGINGFCAGPEVDGLIQAMIDLDAMDLMSYEQMSTASRQLGTLLNLSSWVDNFESGVERIKTHKSGGGG